MYALIIESKQSICPLLIWAVFNCIQNSIVKVLVIECAILLWPSILGADVEPGLMLYQSRSHNPAPLDKIYTWRHAYAMFGATTLLISCSLALHEWLPVGSCPKALDASWNIWHITFDQCMNQEIKQSLIWLMQVRKYPSNMPSSIFSSLKLTLGGSPAHKKTGNMSEVTLIRPFTNFWRVLSRKVDRVQMQQEQSISIRILIEVLYMLDGAKKPGKDRVVETQMRTWALTIMDGRWDDVPSWVCWDIMANPLLKSGTIIRSNTCYDSLHLQT